MHPESLHGELENPLSVDGVSCPDSERNFVEVSKWAYVATAVVGASGYTLAPFHFKD